MPNADQAGAAKQVASGVVAYDSGNGSASAVQATEDGGVRMLTIIDNPSAPTEYDYKVTVPNGGHIELTEDGGAVVLDANGEAISIVGTPWAKDANGTPVNTWHLTDGQTLTQYVQHDVPGVVYPVTADPIWFAVSAAVFWWAVQRCGTWGILGTIAQYASGNTSPRSLAVAGAFGCMSSFVGGGAILKQMFRVIKW